MKRALLLLTTPIVAAFSAFLVIASPEPASALTAADCTSSQVWNDTTKTCDPKPATSTAATPSPKCERNILTFPTWFRGLAKIDKANTDGSVECSIINPNDHKGGLSGFIWSIVLNVIEIGLQLVGYMAVGFIIVGGFRYMTGGGNPSSLQAAKTTITNAIIGLVISLASVAIVRLIFGVFGS